MNNKAALPDTPILFGVDISRTKRPDQQSESFYWDGETLVHVGERKLKMAKALSQLSPAIKTSFKQHLISFTKQGRYATNTYATILSVLKTALDSNPTGAFDTAWIARALTNSSFHRSKSGLTQFFLHWKERDSAAITLDAIHFMNGTAAIPTGKSNVLSDDPEESWLTDEEYEGLLRTVWDNYDIGVSDIQVTLIKLLSMQYARRPIQISFLKNGDIRKSDGSDTQGLMGPIIDFPGVKDINSEANFRDSKFEPHPLADHLWDLCQIQRHKVRTLYEHTLGFALTDDQLNKLPLFCSEGRIEEARQIIEGHHQLNLIESLGSSLFHLRKLRIGQILNWMENTPNCKYSAEKPKRTLRPEPPISPRTGQIMVITATRMRHTRARQLARLGVPRHMLSHWLGHTSERSLGAYYNDPAEEARQLDEAMAPVLAPLAMAFAGTLIDSEDQATRASDPTSKLEFARADELKSVGRCGKHSFCATTSVPIPCYRCKYFEPLVDAPHSEVLEALIQRQTAEKEMLKIGGLRNLLIPVDLSADIRAVKNCIARCDARQAEREMNP